MVEAAWGSEKVKAVIMELTDQFGKKLVDFRYNANEVDAISDLARKQQARMVLSTGEPRSLKLTAETTLNFRRVGA
jgi:hypothetical protein